MANWSNTYIEINGSEEKINKINEILKYLIEDENDNTGLTDYYYYGNSDKSYYLVTYKEKKIKELFPELDIEKLKKLYPTFDNVMEITEYEKSDHNIYITGYGRWAAPTDFFKFLTQKYKVDLLAVDTEPGDNFSYILKMEEGKVIEEKEDNFFSSINLKYMYNDDLDSFYEATAYDNLKRYSLTELTSLKENYTNKEAILDVLFYSYDIDYKSFSKDLENLNFKDLFKKYESIFDKVLDDLEENDIDPENVAMFLTLFLEKAENLKEIEPLLKKYERFFIIAKDYKNNIPEVKKVFEKLFNKKQIKQFLKEKNEEFSKKNISNKTRKQLIANETVFFVKIVPEILNKDKEKEKNPDIN